MIHLSLHATGNWPSQPIMLLSWKSEDLTLRTLTVVYALFNSTICPSSSSRVHPNGVCDHVSPQPLIANSMYQLLRWHSSMPRQKTVQNLLSLSPSVPSCHHKRLSRIFPHCLPMSPHAMTKDYRIFPHCLSLSSISKGIHKRVLNCDDDGDDNDQYNDDKTSATTSITNCIWQRDIFEAVLGNNLNALSNATNKSISGQKENYPRWVILLVFVSCLIVRCIDLGRIAL